jgi:hypothetical protein
VKYPALILASISTRESSGIISEYFIREKNQRERLWITALTIRDRHTFMYDNALLDYGVVFHIRHGQHSIDLGNAEPMQDIGHESLETHLQYILVNETCANKYVEG